jgi:hypothetical protein
MPIEHEIDHQRRLVLAKGHGTLTDAEVFHYQSSVWSHPEVAGYDELIDMSDVADITLPSSERIRELVQLSAAMDDALSPSRLAIVAPDDFPFALGRMYEAGPGQTKHKDGGRIPLGRRRPGLAGLRAKRYLS